MRKMVLCQSLLFLFSLGAFAQVAPVRAPLSSTVSEAARFEIVQASKQGELTHTLRLDRYTGRVFQIGSCPLRGLVGTGLCWREMLVLELPKNSVDGVVLYQLFMSGERERYIFLMNTITGQTWQLGVEAPDRWSRLVDTMVLPDSFDVIR